MNTNTITADTITHCVDTRDQFENPRITLGSLYRDSLAVFHATRYDDDFATRDTVVARIVKPSDGPAVVRIDHYIGEAKACTKPHRTIVVMTVPTSYYREWDQVAAVLARYGYDVQN